MDAFYVFAREYPTLFAVLIGSAFFFPLIIRNYISFLSLKPNFGLANPFIYILSLILRLISRETLSTEEYDSPGEIHDSWLDVHLPRRKGSRPRIGWFPAPHRQMSQWATPEMIKKIPTALKELAAAHPDTLRISRSKHELHTDALFVSDSISNSPSGPPPHKTCKEAYGEIAHVHDGFEFSLHVVLAPQDCKRVILNGWGERHPCAGRLKGLPKEYLLIYTPRDEEELHVIRDILKAAAAFMSGQHHSHLL